LDDAKDHRGDVPAQGKQSFASVVAAQAATAASVPWLEAARSDRVVDRAELAASVEQWRTSGLAGRRVGLLTTDPVAFGTLFVSLLSVGATVVPLDPNAPAEAIRSMVVGSRTALAVTTLDDPPVGDLPVIGVDPVTWAPEGPANRARFDGRAPGGTATTTDGGCVLFSSGSTGPRKAIRLDEAQLLHVARAVARAYELGPADRGFNSLPLTHVNGEVVGLLAPLVSGGTVVLDDRFHRTGFWDVVAQRRATWVNAVPSIITILAQEPPGPTAPTAPASVRFVRSASAPLSEAVLARFEQRYGVPVIESYGMTEAGSQITANPLTDRRPGTVGVPVDVELRVVGEDDAPLPLGGVGRVEIRGAGVIRQYENGVGADRFDVDGWLDTGDLGAVDQDGFLTLAGREGDVINRGGEKIFPREVEDVLLAHRAVADAVVVGRDDEVLGQVPVAYVVPAPDAPDDLEEQLRARCLAALPRAHRPVAYVVLDSVPVGPTGKPVRRLVADLDRESLTAGGATR
jgi:acyl-CoA synthetase (AMP-forming)/AMP-acid ligase II